MFEVNDTLVVTVPKEDDTDNPWLRGPWRPQRNEYSVIGNEMTVTGEIPTDLDGVYIRNTHNQAQQPTGIYHPFDGDGMLHAMRFRDGTCEYRNRFVRTTGFLAEQGAGKSLWPGLLQPQEYQRRGWGAMGSMKDNAGTDVIAHAGHVIASHYKVDNETGEMIFFNYPEKAPFMNYGVVNREDRLVHYVPIELPGARWPHDLGMTKNYSILHDLPFFFDADALAQGAHKLTFHADLPARFGVIPRHGRSEDVRWFEASPCFVMHLGNCYEDGDWVVQDGCIWDDPVHPPVGDPSDVYGKIARQLDKHATHTHLYRWSFNMVTGQVREEVLDDEVTEFPIVSNDYVGRQYRYSYNSLFTPGHWLMSGIKRYDVQTGAMTRYEYGDQRYGSEPCVALRENYTAEDDGYVITFVNDMAEDTSECLIFEASDIAAGPVCSIVLPERISAGTHACWVEGDRMEGENRQYAARP
jgi:carotenoid cleavage dioxygenase-like enzyme